MERTYETLGDMIQGFFSGEFPLRDMGKYISEILLKNEEQLDD